MEQAGFCSDSRAMEVLITSDRRVSARHAMLQLFKRSKGRRKKDFETTDSFIEERVIRLRYKKKAIGSLTRFGKTSLSCIQVYKYADHITNPNTLPYRTIVYKMVAPVNLRRHTRFTSRSNVSKISYRIKTVCHARYSCVIAQIQWTDQLQ